MKSISGIRKELEQDRDLNVIRCDIADLILHHLQRSKAESNAGAFDHLTNAVGTLTLNVYADHQPNKAGLNVCLADIELAIIELDEPDSTYQLIRKRIESVTYTMLTEAVQRIRYNASCVKSNNGQAA